MSCTVGPDYRAPDQAMPEHWTSPTNTGTSVAVEQPPVSIERWWQEFKDPVLDSLVRRALESNLDLEAAAARVRQARATMGVVGAGLYPNVNASSSYSVDGVVRGGSTELWRTGLDATWELDIFGGIRRSVEASSANLQATLEDRRDVQVTLLGELATDYFQYRGLQQELSIAESNLEAQQRNVTLTQSKKKLGTGTELDVSQAQVQVAGTQAQMASLESARQQALYAISVLLGRQPTALDTELQDKSPIPAPPSVLPVGVPSELLRRRPDIRRAERQLAAATAQIGVATADLYPHFSLSAGLGVQGPTFASMGNVNDGTWSLGPGISWPLFAAGRIRSNIEVQNALQSQAMTTFRKTVIVALQEVQNALVAFAKEQERRVALTTAVEGSQRSVAYATRRYQQGLTDFLSVLDAQRSLFASQVALVQSDRAVGTDAVALYKALGGGWEITDEPIAPDSTTAPGPASTR